MEKQRKINQSILAVALVTVLILMVPLVAMQFTNEVDWSLPDFIVMGALLFGTGLSFVLIIRFANSIAYKAAAGLALGTTLFMIWANLAVGLIGSGANMANLMYMAIVAVVIIGIIFSRFKPGGMERAMYTTAVAIVLVAVIELLTNMDVEAGSSTNEIVAVNGFFALLYAIAGALFHYSAVESSHPNENLSR